MKNKIFGLILLIFSCSLVQALSVSDNFSLGTYINTTYNGSNIFLSGFNLTGIYASGIFDGGNITRWDNLSANLNIPYANSIYSADTQAGVYYSVNNGTNWKIKNASYTSSTPGNTQDIFSDLNGSLYILKNSDRQVWRSDDKGASWVNVNSTFSNRDLYAGTSDSYNLYVFVGTGAGYKSSNRGASWSAITDFNGGATNNPVGATVNSSGAVFVVDTAGKVFYSNDNGTNWTNVNAGYGRTTDTQKLFVDYMNNLYIITNTNKEVWKSTNSGVNWSVINNTFSGSSYPLSGMGDSSKNIYVIAGQSTGIVYKSTNNGITWTLVNNSYNGGNGGSRGIASLLFKTNLSFQIRNCSLPDCSDGEWQSFNLNNINITSRYFQYKVVFSSYDNSLTPFLYGVQVQFSILNLTGGNNSTGNETGNQTGNQTEGNPAIIYGGTSSGTDKEDNPNQYNIYYLPKEELTKQVIIIVLIMFAFFSLIGLLIFLIIKVIR